MDVRKDHELMGALYPCTFLLVVENIDKKELSKMAGKGRPRMSEEHKRKKNAERVKNWRKKNPEAARRIQERYWMKRIAKMQQQADDTTAV